MTKAEEILEKHLKINDVETMLGKHGTTHKAVIDALNEAINYTKCCTELKTFDIHECINEVSDEAQRRSFAVYDLKEDRSFRYGVKKAIDKMIYNK